VPASGDNIATFVEVARQRSLSAAARTLGLPKSTVSRRLARLEEELQNKLLERDARKVVLTPAGRRFFTSVEAAVDTLDAAVADLEESRKLARGAIRLTAPPDLARMQLAPMFVAFLERHPEITLDLVLTSRMLDLSSEGVDLAVRAGRIEDDKLYARKVCESELQLATAASNGARVTLGTLANEPFVLYRAPSRRQTFKLERGLGKRRKSVDLTVTGRINVDDYASMAELVAAGSGFGLMPAIHVRDGERAGRLQRVLPEWSTRAGHIYLVYATRPMPERVRLLAAFLTEAFAAIEHV